MSIRAIAPLDPISSTEEELVASFEPLVQRIAGKYAVPDPAMALEDYFQVLRLELVVAIRNWSPTGGASLFTYAYRALTKQCLNTRRDQRLMGYRANWELEMPLVVSLDAVAHTFEDGSTCTLVDLIAGSSDTFTEAQARCLASRAWALADELLRYEPRLLQVLELTVGRYGTPFAQKDIAKCFGVTQVTAGRWLRQARKILLADPRSWEFVGND